MSISLASYTFQINTRGLTDFLNLHQFSPNTEEYPFNSFFSYFDYLCEHLQGYQDFEEFQKIIEIEPPRYSTGFIRSGHVNVGEYGIKQDLIDIETSELAFQREINHAGRMPFYYLIGIPRNSRIGFAFLEKFRGYSASSVIRALIKATFQRSFPNNLIKFEAAATAELIEGLYNSAQLKDLTVISHTIPRDYAQYIVNGPNAGKMLFSYQPTDLRVMGGLINAMKDRARNRSLLQFGDEQFEIEKIKVTLKVNGKDKVINVLNPLQNYRPLIDISSQLEYQEDHRATFESINNQAIELYNIYRNSVSRDA